MTVLRSYVEGRWHAPDGGAPVYDAVTGYLVTEVSSAGVDFGAALSYGREAGGPGLLRALTFHERAELVKAVGQLLRKHRDELYELSYRTGATLFDSKFDIDGGIGVLLSYASKAKRELPNDTVPWRARPSSSARRATSSVSTCSPRCTAWRCRSTPSTSPSGVRWRSWHRRSSPACLLQP